MVWLEKEAKIHLLGGKITDFNANLVPESQDIDIWYDNFFMDKGTGRREAAWFFVRDRGRFWKILHEDVLFIEARKSYCHIQTLEKPWLILTLLGNFESVLPEGEFLRIHRSYIINLRHLQSFDQRTAYLPGHQIPIGESYRTVVREHVLMVMPAVASCGVFAAG